MKTAFPLLLMLALGCGSSSQPETPAIEGKESPINSADATARTITPPAPGEPIDSEAEAIAVVLAEIQRSGDDSERVECSASLIENRWLVNALFIYYPENKGDQRFVPGGFTTYIVSKDGVILETLPGL